MVIFPSFWVLWRKAGGAVGSSSGEKHNVKKHPGQFLHFLLFESEMLVDDAAEEAGLTGTEIRDFLAGKIAVTQELAAKLAKLGGTTPELWLELQDSFDEDR